MNYIKQMKAFREHRKLNPISANAVALYLILFEENNELQFPETFRLGHSYIKEEIGLCDREYRRAREELVKGGYILYAKGDKRSCGIYSIIDFSAESPSPACRETAANSPLVCREPAADLPQTCRETYAENQHDEAENSGFENNSCRETAANLPLVCRESAVNLPQTRLSSYLYKNNKHKTINTPLTPQTGGGDGDEFPEDEFQGQQFDHVSENQEDKQISDICDYWTKTVRRQPSTQLPALVRSCLKGGMEPALVCHAIDISASSAKTPWPYFQKVMQNIMTTGITTLKDYKTTGPPKNSIPDYGDEPEIPEW